LGVAAGQSSAAEELEGLSRTSVEAEEPSRELMDVVGKEDTMEEVEEEGVVEGGLGGKTTTSHRGIEMLASMCGRSGTCSRRLTSTDSPS